MMNWWWWYYVPLIFKVHLQCLVNSLFLSLDGAWVAPGVFCRIWKSFAHFWNCCWSEWEWKMRLHHSVFKIVPHFLKETFSWWRCSTRMLQSHESWFCKFRQCVGIPRIIRLTQKVMPTNHIVHDVVLCAKHLLSAKWDLLISVCFFATDSRSFWSPLREWFNLRSSGSTRIHWWSQTTSPRGSCLWVPAV